jgi:hypothetical protein
MDTKYILFTGAGFTHNFGAPLAKGMWTLIFNHEEVQGQRRIKELMQSDYDFESIYDAVLNGNFAADEKQAIMNAVKAAYEKLDAIIRNWSFKTNAPYPVNIYQVQNFIDLFSKRNQKGFVFTINQDLFLERHYYNGERPIIPGIQTKQNLFSSTFREPLGEGDYSELPSIEKLEKCRDKIIGEHRFFYIKMHGSQNWRKANKTNQIVIGRGKKQQIEEEPLLNWYFELFKEALLQKDKRILFVGYGFGDEHINRIIAKAIGEYSVGIHIICPNDVDIFHAEILKRDFGKDIWKGLSGYYQCSLTQLFPTDQSESQEYDDLRRQFFGIKV